MFLRRFGKLFVTTSLVGEKSTLRGWSHHFGFAAMCFSYLDAKVSQRFLRFAKSTWSAPAFQKWIPTPLNCYVAKTILCLDPLLGSAWISGPWLARPETTLLRSFNTLCRRVIRSDDFHNMRKISLWDWICKKCKKWKTFQNMSYLKISKNNLEKSQKNRTSGGSKWEVKETTIWDTKKSQNIWTNLTISQKKTKHARKCKNMQNHVLICKHSSDQHGYDCEGCSKVICLQCLTCVLAAWCSMYVVNQTKCLSS